MLLKRARLIFLFTASSFFTKGQDANAVLPAAGDTLTFSDSLAIFRLLDSLMSMPAPDVSSQLAMRLGYNSNVLSAGRTLGIEQFGLAPGLSYYHKSGAYADVSMFWSNDFDPSLYLTVASAGYMHFFSDRFSAVASYDHYFYNFPDGSYIPYANALTVAPYVDLEPFSLRLDYSFYFGDARAHRIMPGLSLNLEKKKFLGLDRISLYPAAYILFGNETLSEVRFTRPTSVREALENLLKYGTRYGIVVKEKNVFGLMNYAFSLPLNLSHGRWTLNVTYTYSVPKALDDEPLVLTESSFLSAGLLCYIDLIRNKKSL